MKIFTNNCYIIILLPLSHRVIDKAETELTDCLFPSSLVVQDKHSTECRWSPSSWTEPRFNRELDDRFIYLNRVLGKSWPSWMLMLITYL